MELTPQQKKNLGIFLSRGHVKWEEIEAALEIKIALGQSPLTIIPEEQKDALPAPKKCG